MKEFKREDYVYLRLTEDFEDEKVKYKKVLRKIARDFLFILYSK